MNKTYSCRHQIHAENYCNRDPIFGDMIACLTK